MAVPLQHSESASVGFFKRRLKIIHAILTAHLFWALTVAWSIAALAALWIGPVSLMTDTIAFALFGSLLSSLIVLTFGLRIFERLKTTVADLSHSDTEVATDVTYFAAETVRTRKRPLVKVLHDSKSIAEEAADLVRGCLETGEIGGYRLIFLGATSFQTPSARSADDQFTRTEGRTSPDQIYHGSLEEIASKSLKVGRFVSLLEVDEFLSRAPTVRTRYLNWLNSQHGQMKRNANYVIIDSKRAPKWGALGAMIVSSDRMIQFSHPTGSALTIRDTRIVNSIVRSSIAEVERSQRSNLKAYVKEVETTLTNANVYDISNIQAFSDRIDEYDNRLRKNT